MPVICASVNDPRIELIGTCRAAVACLGIFDKTQIWQNEQGAVQNEGRKQQCQGWD